MKKKSIVIIAITAIVVLGLSLLAGSGFRKRPDVVLTDYSVSEDGTKLSFSVGVASSMGYTRGFKDNGGGVKPHYLTFYSTFGGLNSSFGAKSEFELDLAETDTEIWFNRTEGGYELVLQKNAATGEWEKDVTSSTPKTSEFSYEEDRKIYKENDPGVKHSGFNNSSKVAIETVNDAIEQAKKECTIEYDTVNAYYDNTAYMWKIVFSTADTVGGDQSVYLDGYGVTCLIVYGE